MIIAILAVLVTSTIASPGVNQTLSDLEEFLTFIAGAYNSLRLLEMKIQALEAKIDKNYTTKLTVDTKLQAINTKIGGLERLVFFRVTFEKDSLEVLQGVVKFDSVVENEGDGYNPFTGYFTAPVRGLYVFAVHAFSRGQENHDVNWDLFTLSNEEVEVLLLRSRAVIEEESTDYTCVTSLQAGQVVFVRNSYQQGLFIGNGHSFFSGWLVKPY